MKQRTQSWHRQDTDKTERCHEHSLKDWDRFNAEGMTCYSHGRKSMVYDMNIAKEECHELHESTQMK